MTRQELERIAFLLRNRAQLPFELAMPLHDAIVDYLQDQVHRSLDFHLYLPPRRPGVQLPFGDQRAALYRELAGEIPGSARKATDEIRYRLELWQAGDVDARSLGEAFSDFLRDFQELHAPHLGETQLRDTIAPTKRAKVADFRPRKSRDAG